MTLRRQLLTSNQSVIDIVSDDPQTENHFANPSNFADIVLNQINNDRFYDQIFDGEENLTVIDIGGNIGLFTLYAQDRSKVIYSIEPTPDHFHILKELTKDYKNVIPLNIAVSNENRIIDFYINESNTTMNSLANKYGTKVEVEAKTLKSIINDLNLTHVDFIKCDIEGSEMIALTDDTVSEVKDLVDCWFIEVHATDVTTDSYQWAAALEKNRRTLADIFTRQGYEVQDYRHDGLFISRP